MIASLVDFDSSSAMSIWVYSIPDLPPNEVARRNAAIALDACRHVGDPVLAKMTAEACIDLNVAMAAITLVEEFDAVLIATSGFPAGSYKRSTSLCAHAILSETRTFCVPDALEDERFAGNPYVSNGGGIRFYAAAQLVVNANLVIGTFCIFDVEPRSELCADGQDRLLAFATRATSYLQTRINIPHLQPVQTSNVD